MYYPTAALVFEIVSPGEETWKKRPFFAAHQVDELLIIDPLSRTASLLAPNASAEYSPIEGSRVIELAAVERQGEIDWR